MLNPPNPNCTADQLDGVLYDARWIGNHGIGRFAAELQKQIPGLISFSARRRPSHALDPAFLSYELLRWKPCLFFSPGYNSPLGWRGRFIFTLHDLHHLCVPENSSPVKRAYYDLIIKPACHRAAAVLTVSEYSKQEICRWANVSQDRVVNVGNGVGEPFGPSGPTQAREYPFLLYVGSHKVHKNLPRLLTAFARSGVSEDVHLLMTGPPEPPLTSVIRELRLENRVAFVGVPSNQELATYYRGALALLFPSLYEGFGLPPLEAMACGTPVLTSNVCALPEIVGDAALLVDPTNTDAISDGIRRISQDGAFRAHLQQKGLTRAQHFTWSKTAERTLLVLQSVIGRFSKVSAV